jgi:hypothetical protein
MHEVLPRKRRGPDGQGPPGRTVIDGDATAQHQSATVIGFVVAAVERDQVAIERGGTSTLVIEPVGYEGFRFDPVQFGWIAVGRSPFSITQHPFSFSSVADTPPSGPVAMTIKAAGDFTRTVPAVTAGTRVYAGHAVVRQRHLG